MDEDDSVISPELALVTPELRARAIAALPPIDLDVRPVWRAPATTASPHVEPGIGTALVRTAWVAVSAFATTVILVLSLTLVADAIRV